LSRPTFKTFPLIALAAGAALAISACSSESDTTAAVNDFNTTLNQGAKKEAAAALEKAGASASTAEAEAARINFELDCPDSVKKEENFTCTLSGEPGGASGKVKMVVDSDNQLKPINDAEFQKQLNGVIKSASEQLATQAATG